MSRLPLFGRRRFRTAAVLLTVGGLALAGARVLTAQSARTDVYQPSLFQGMEWRNVGPFRGGRVTTVAGVPSQPMVYYMGAAGGGIWKTTTRACLAQRLRRLLQGRRRSAQSPCAVRFRTWSMSASARRRCAASDVERRRRLQVDRCRPHLDAQSASTTTRHISRIAIHPTGSGHGLRRRAGQLFGADADRGVYRTQDGGTDLEAGASRQRHGRRDRPGDGPEEPAHPVRRLLGCRSACRGRCAAAGRAAASARPPTAATAGRSSTKGLPTGALGKIGVAVSPADPRRVWANIEAEDGGVYRSDDGGATLDADEPPASRAPRPGTTRRSSPIRSIRTPSTSSTRRCQVDRRRADVPAVRMPHGDNHGLWINPRDERNMINGNDGGAAITFDGGETWSTEDNQPTAQFYRVEDDQRSRTGSTAGSRTTRPSPSRAELDGGIDRPDWFHVRRVRERVRRLRSEESELHLRELLPGDPRRVRPRDEVQRQVTPNPEQGLGDPSNEQRYRFNWNAPVVASPENPTVIYLGGNVLFRTADRGRRGPSSARTSRATKRTQGLGGGPITNEGAGDEVYRTILSIEPRRTKRDDLGRHRRRPRATHARRRQDVDQRHAEGARERPDQRHRSVAAAGDGVVAATGYKWNDFTPYAFRTTDYGKTWTPITAGFPGNDSCASSARIRSGAVCCMPARRAGRTSRSTTAGTGRACSWTCRSCRSPT